VKKINKKKLADVKASHQTKISKGKNITNDDIKDLLDAMGIEEVPEDHPVYKEGPFLIFLNKKN
jgi:hypothetical protein|tara:strand:+ start:259 stop:450 length:192 start_codon:yes stop_codon:yes gene_type:complete